MSIKPVKKNKVAYAIWLFGDACKQNGKSPSARDLTLSWLRFGFQGDVIESVSIDEILCQACESGSDICFIQRPGNMISEDWMLPHWGIPDIHACLNQSVARNDFLICADFVKTDDYYVFNTQCLLINLRQYQKLDKPDFGYAGTKVEKLVKPESGLQSSVEDEQLEASGETIQTAPVTDGWKFVDMALRESLVVPKLPKSISDKCVRLAPDPMNINMRHESIRSAREQFLNNVNRQVACGKKGVFLWNIESYDDVVAGSGTEVDFNAIASIPKIKNLYCVAAGFKPNMLLHRHGFDSNAKVMFFDYSQQALDIRKTLLSEWDGSDYPGICRKIMQRFSEEETFYQLWNGLRPFEIDWLDVDRLWQAELAHWGGADNFQRVWQEQLKLDYDFVRCDIVDNPVPMLERMRNSEAAVIWWSNAFFTVSSNWLLSIEQRRQKFQYWIERLAECCPRCYLYGANHNNTPVNNIYAAEYLEVLKKQLRNAERNELKPERELALPLRF